jgi:hypothetical protein
MRHVALREYYVSHFGALRLEIEYKLTIIKTRAVILRETAHLH